MPKKTFDGTAAALGSGDCLRGVQLLADDDNSGSVYVGYADTVTAGTADATDGMRLTAGKSYVVPPSLATSLASIFIIGSASGQIVYYDVL